jgi:flagellar biosynthetic protein FliP
MPRAPHRSRGARLLVVGLALVAAFLILWSDPASAQVPEAPTAPTPTVPTPGADPAGDDVTIELPDADQPSQSVLIIVLLTLLSLAPALVVTLSSFTRIVIVLSLTRNALGLHNVPPNQVIVGLALFLSIFVMGPTLKQINDDALQPLLNGEQSYEQAYDSATGPLRDFMLEHTGEKELSMFHSVQDGERPASPEDVSMTALVPAFILSELKTAFIIAFVIFIPFLVIDLIVSSSLMSMGMMMLPPVMVSLPLKMLLFVLMGGWNLIVETLLTSFS